MAIQQIKLGGKSIVPDVFSVLSTASGSTTAPSSVADIRNSTSPILNINGSGHLYHLYVPHTAMLNIEIDGKKIYMPIYMIMFLDDVQMDKTVYKLDLTGL